MSKLLFIRYKKSANILEGGEQGSEKNYNVFCHLLGKENVDVIFIHDENNKRSILYYLKGSFWFLHNYFFGLNPKRVRQIVNLAFQYDYVHIDRSIFGIIAKELKKNNYTGKVFCFFHNVETVYFKAKLHLKPWKSFIIHCVDRNDAWSCQYADKIIALNQRDAKLLEELYGRRADILIPVAFKDKYQQASYPKGMTAKRPNCMVLGAYFPPNNEGIEWLANEILPEVNIHLRVVGKGMDKLRQNYKIPDEVEIISDAPDLQPYFENTDIMILPIFSGSGMKVKTCESLMYGKNIIATDEAWEGYELDYKLAGSKCNTKEEFIKALQDFIDKPRPRFNKYTRQIFLDKYSEESVKELFQSIL